MASVTLSKRVTALIIAVCFCGTNIFGSGHQVYAQPVREIPGLAEADLSLKIPAEFGSIVDVVKAPSQNPVLIHIRTAHGNDAAQKNIRALLQYLTQTCGIRLVLLEGAGYRLDPELLKVFSEKTSNAKFLEVLTKNSQLTGAEAFLAEQVAGVQGWGVESVESYRENREAFKSVLSKQNRIKDFLGRFHGHIQQIVLNTHNAELKEFLVQRELFVSGQMKWEEWIGYLKSRAKENLEIDLEDAAFQRSWPVLVRFAKLQKIANRLDARKIRRETMIFIRHMKAQHISPGLLKALIRTLRQPGNRKDFKPGCYPEMRFLFERLLDELPGNFSFDRYPNLKLYIQQLIFVSELKGDRLMIEAERLSTKLARFLVRSPYDARLLGVTQDFQVFSKLMNLELSRREAELFLKRPKNMGRFKPAGLLDRSNFLNAPDKNQTKNRNFTNDFAAAELSEMDASFENALFFYHGAIAREESMTRNILERMRREKTEKAILITGGFHSEGLRELLHNAGYNYIGVMPSIDSEVSRDGYLRALLGKSIIGKSQLEVPLRTDFRFLSELKDPAYVRDIGTALRGSLDDVLSGVPVSQRAGLTQQLNESKLARFYSAGLTVPKVQDPTRAEPVLAQSAPLRPKDRSELRRSGLGVGEELRHPVISLLAIATLGFAVASYAVAGPLPPSLIASAVIGQSSNHIIEERKREVEKQIRVLSSSTDVGERRHAVWLLGRCALDANGWIDYVDLVPKLIETLADEDHEVRLRAIQALGFLKKDSHAFSALIYAMGNHEDKIIKREAAEALGEIKDHAAVPALIRALGDKDIRVKAATALGKIEDSSAVPALLEGLADTDFQFRAAIVGALGQIKDRRAAPALIAALGDVDITYGVAISLGEIKDSSAVPALIDILKGKYGDGSRAVAAVALRKLDALSEVPSYLHKQLFEYLAHGDEADIRALGKIKDPMAFSTLIKVRGSLQRGMPLHAPVSDGYLYDAFHEFNTASAVPVLIKALTDDSALVREAAASFLGDVRDPIAVPALTKTLADSNHTVRLQALSALREIKDATVIPALMTALVSEDKYVRLNAMLAFAEIKDPAAVPALITASADVDKSIRISAIEALGEIKDASAVQALITASADADKDIRISAIEALGKIKDPAAVPALIAASADVAQNVRYEAIRAIGIIKDKSAVPVLIKRMTDDDRRVRDQAIESLAEINDPAVLPVLVDASVSSDSPNLAEHELIRLARRDPAVRSFLIKELDAPVSRRVLCILKVLRDIDSPTVNRALFRWLEEKPSHRYEVMPALERPSAVPGWIEILNSDNQELHRLAAAVLRRGYKYNLVDAYIKSVADHFGDIRDDKEKAQEYRAYRDVIEKIGISDRELRSLKIDFKAIEAYEREKAESFIFWGTVGIIGTLMAGFLGFPFWRKVIKKFRDKTVILLLAATMLAPAGAPHAKGGPLPMSSIIAATAIEQLPEQKAELNELPKEPVHGDNKARENTAKDVMDANDPFMVPVLIRAVENGSPDARFDAIKTLKKIKDPAAVPVLIKAMADEDELIRWAAVDALVEIKDPRAVQPFLRALEEHDRFWLVDRRIIYGLGEVGDPAAFPALMKMLRKESGNVYVEASAGNATVSGAIAKIKAPWVAAALVKEVLSGEGKYGDHAADNVKRALDGRVDDPITVQALAAALDSAHGYARDCVIHLLAQIKDPSVVPALKKLALDADLDIAWRASRALERIEPAGAQALIDLLSDKNLQAQRRSLFVASLGRMNDPSSAHALLVSSTDESSLVRDVALAALQSKPESWIVKYLEEIAIKFARVEGAEEKETVYREYNDVFDKVNIDRARLRHNKDFDALEAYGSARTASFIKKSALILGALILGIGGLVFCKIMVKKLRSKTLVLFLAPTLALGALQSMASAEVGPPGTRGSSVAAVAIQAIALPATAGVSASTSKRETAAENTRTKNSKPAFSGAGTILPRFRSKPIAETNIFDYRAELREIAAQNYRAGGGYQGLLLVPIKITDRVASLFAEKYRGYGNLLDFTVPAAGPGIAGVAEPVITEADKEELGIFYSNLLEKNSQTRRRIVDYREMPKRPEELDAWFLYSWRHPEVEYTLLLNAEKESVLQMRGELSAYIDRRYPGAALPLNFKIVAVAPNASLVSTVQRFISSDVSPVGFVCEDEVLMRKIGFRTKPVLLRVIGSKNPVAQNVTGLLAAEYLKEDIASGILAKILTRDDLDREHIFATLFAVLQSRQSVSASA